MQMPKVGDVVTEIIDDPNTSICKFTTVYVADPDPDETYRVLSKIIADRLWEERMKNG